MSKYKLDKSAQVVEKSNYIMTQEEVCERLNDLEAKLAESEKEKDYYQDLYFTSVKGQEKLKQQLAEKEKENNELVFIIEEIEQFAWEQLNNENFDKYKAYDEMLTKIKQLTKNSPYENHQQDKISFAVEQLEKVNKFYNDNVRWHIHEKKSMQEFIDNQIKQLKEGE